MAFGVSGKEAGSLSCEADQVSLGGAPLSPRSVPTSDCPGRVVSWHAGPQHGAGGLEAGAAESGALRAPAQACKVGRCVLWVHFHGSPAAAGG